MTALRRHSMELICMLALVGGAVTMVWALAGSLKPQQVSQLQILGVVLLAVSAVGTLWSYRCRIAGSVRAVRKQLENLRQEERLGQVFVDRTDQIGELAGPLNRSLQQLCEQVDRLRRENRTQQIRSAVQAEHHRQTEDVLRLVSDAVFVTNRFDELIFANPAAEKALNFELETATRKNIDQVFSDGALVRLVREARKTGRSQPQRIMEQTLDENQSSRTYSIVINTLSGPADSICGVVVLMHDITAQKQAELESNEFISNVSHELKTPLSSIMAYVEMLLDGEVDGKESMREFHETISAEANRLHRMIDRILTISRIESGATRVIREPVSMTAVARHVKEVIAPQAHQKGVELLQELPPVYIQVEADFDLLCQAVMNLLTNAIKYTPPGGRVELNVTTDDRRRVAVVEVRDTGIGIPADEMPRIFQKFYRVRANMKMAPGTGLGLPLVKYIVEKVHGGKLSVTSETGKGSTFSFELPLVV